MWRKIVKSPFFYPILGGSLIGGALLYQKITKLPKKLSSQLLEIQTFHGEIQNSKYIIKVPSKNVTGNVVIFCHGYRPKGVKLQANIPKYKLYDRLLEEGFIVAALSYRREGYILEDAMGDINNLRNFIILEFLLKIHPSKIKFVLSSQSMGGAITTLVAERFPKLYNCVFAIGAALYIDPIKEKKNNNKENAIDFLHTPQIPILYLMNETECAPIKSYRRKVHDKNQKLVKNIFLWYVSRPGHCYVTDKEVEKSFYSIYEYANRINLKREDDVTDYSPVKSMVKFNNEKGGSIGKVEYIDEVGTVELNFIPTDFNILNIVPGNNFIVHHKNNRYTFLYGNFPFVGVENGKYVALNNGCNIILKKHSIKTIINDIVKEMQIKVGDVVFIEQIKLQTKTKTQRKKPQLSKSMRERLKKFTE